MTTTLRQELMDVIRERGDEHNPVVMTCTKEELDKEFDNGYGSPEMPVFTAWSADYVYFPVQYDGATWVGSVNRNPCAVKTEHIGG